jgi:hypothetical protein
LRIWVDIVTPPQAFFFHSVATAMEREGHEFYFTAARYGETPRILTILGRRHKVRGTHRAGRFTTWEAARRIYQVLGRLHPFEAAFSSAATAPIVSRLAGKLCYAFTDNESPKAWYNQLITFRLADKIFCPESIRSLGTGDGRMIHYPGFKEDIYVADYQPDPDFQNHVPVHEYIALRAEALDATYVSAKRSIVPEIVKELINREYNILYLPRQRDPFRAKQARVFRLDEPLNGLDITWNAQAVLTGSGTLAREAASLGVPAVSFYPEKLLSVDQELVNQGKVLHTRDPHEIADYVEANLSRPRTEDWRQRTRNLKTKFLEIVIEAIDEG